MDYRKIIQDSVLDFLLNQRKIKGTVFETSPETKTINIPYFVYNSFIYSACMPVYTEQKPLVIDFQKSVIKKKIKKALDVELYEIVFTMYKSGSRELKPVLRFLRRKLQKSLNFRDFSRIKNSFLDSVDFETTYYKKAKSGRRLSKDDLLEIVECADSSDELLAIMKDFSRRLTVKLTYDNHIVFMKMPASFIAFIPVLEASKFS